MKKFREKFVDACYKRTTRIICLIICVIFAVVAAVFELVEILGPSFMFLCCIYSIYATDRNIVEKNNLFLIFLSNKDFWDALVIALAFSSACFQSIIVFICAIIVMIIMMTFGSLKISKFFEKKLEK